MMRASKSTLVLCLSLVCVASLGIACDKSNSTTNPSTTGGEPAPAGDAGDVSAEAGDEPSEAGGEVSWHDMDRDARMTYMGTTVMPAMKEAFMQRGFDTFKCANCHGADSKEVDFKMPNDLTPLNPDNPIQSGMDLDEEMTKFMVSVVTPQMAEMLGEETDPTTGKGEFGCLSCHLSE
jgi:hypothetical protein